MNQLFEGYLSRDPKPSSEAEDEDVFETQSSMDNYFSSVYKRILHERPRDLQVLADVGECSTTKDSAAHQATCSTTLDSFFDVKECCVLCNRLSLQKDVRFFRPDYRELQQHLELLPEDLNSLKESLHDSARKGFDAETLGEWALADRHYSKCWDNLQANHKKIMKDNFVWLLLWVSLPLIYLNQLKLNDHCEADAYCERLLHYLDLGTQAYNAVEKYRMILRYEWGFIVLRKTNPTKGDEFMRFAEEGISKDYDHAKSWICLVLGEIHQAYGNYGDSLFWLMEKQKSVGDEYESEEFVERWNDAKFYADLGHKDEATDMLKDLKVDLEDEHPSYPEKRRTTLLQAVSLDLVKGSDRKFRQEYEVLEDLLIRELYVKRVLPVDVQQPNRVEGEKRDDNFRAAIYELIKIGESSLKLAQSRKRRDLRLREEKAALQDLASLYMVWQSEDGENPEHLETAKRCMTRAVSCLWELGVVFNRETAFLHYMLGNIERQLQEAYRDTGLLILSGRIDELLTADSSGVEVRVPLLRKLYEDYKKTMEISVKHFTIAANSYSDVLYSLRKSTHLDDTWAANVMETTRLCHMGLECQALFHAKAKVSIASRVVDCINQSPEYFQDKSKNAWMAELLNHDYESKVALLWAERAHSCTLSYQLRPNLLSDEASKEILLFAKDLARAWGMIAAAQEACGAACDKQCAFVEYSYSHTNKVFLYYLVKANGEVDMGPIRCSAKELKKLLLTVRTGMSEVDGASKGPRIQVPFHESKEQVVNALKKLSKILIVPDICTMLKGLRPTDYLIFVPCKGLTEVPFNILQDAEGRYLFQQHTISFAPSLRILYHLKTRLSMLEKYSAAMREKGAQPSCLLLGDPAYQDAYSRLAATVDEVNQIASLFQENHVVKKIGCDATVEALMEWAQKPSLEGDCCHGYVHLATHGFNDDKKFQKGALEFAAPGVKEWPPASSGTSKQSELHLGTCARGFDDIAIEEEPQSEASIMDNCAPIQASGEVGGVLKSKRGRLKGRQDRFLRSEDIVGCDFDWRAFMVVLSGCDTTKGMILAEGVLNLPRAFMIAGVPCIVASQWLLDDASNPHLMQAFYQELRKGSDVASSLRSAMLEMMDKYEIFQWGAFVVWGLPTVCLSQELLQCNS